MFTRPVWSSLKNPNMREINLCLLLAILIIVMSITGAKLINYFRIIHENQGLTEIITEN